MRKASSKQKKTFPSWDIRIVLAFLRDVCEPLDKLSMRLLTLKTIFLVAMATARRISGIHAISGLNQYISFDNSFPVDLSFYQIFVPKIKSPHSCQNHFQLPPSLSVKRYDADNCLCPVRALKQYLSSTASFRHGKRRLFISMNPRYNRDIKKSTISRWIKSLIVLAYDHYSSHIDSVNVKAHELRAISSSLSAMLGTPVEAVMRAAFWRSATTFISYYIRDIQHLCRDGRFAFAPAVFAGQTSC